MFKRAAPPGAPPPVPPSHHAPQASSSPTKHTAITIPTTDPSSCSARRSHQPRGRLSHRGDNTSSSSPGVLASAALLLGFGLTYRRFGPRTWDNRSASSYLLREDAAAAPPAPAHAPTGLRPQGFRAVAEVHCNDAQQQDATAATCEGGFEYVPRLAGATPPVVAPEAQAACLGSWTTASEAGSDRSRYEEDLRIYQRYFADRPAADGGFFLELGAYDGLSETNTRLFETCLGWTGLLIEASPVTFQALKRHAARRPNSDLLNVAPSCEAFEYVRLLNQVNTGISLHESVYEGGDVDSWQVKGQCGPFSFYLQQLGVTRIDFMSLDVEGFEYHVLRTLDLAQVDVRVLMVETSNRFYDSGEAKYVALRQQVFDLLAANGYVEDTGIEVSASKVFVKPEVLKEALGEGGGGGGSLGLRGGVE